ncbi:MAG: hypothetical protein MPJ24_05540 [Pirellulaceae bacterium]|nr:hypothetical protein [Pirellulaceae bacterium]
MRSYALYSAVLLSFFIASPAFAQWGYWAKWRESYCRVQNWPNPHSEHDRLAVRMPFEIMVDNGWQRQNTLDDFHFHPETHKLTRAGELKLQWILTEAPLARRTIYVLRSQRKEFTDVRVSTVAQAASQFTAVAGLAMPPILQTNIRHPVTPASRIDAIQRAIPVPTLTLPPMTGAAAGGGG